MNTKTTVQGIYLPIMELAKIAATKDTPEKMGAFITELLKQLLKGSSDPEKCEHSEAGNMARELLARSFEVRKHAKRG